MNRYAQIAEKEKELAELRELAAREKDGLLFCPCCGKERASLHIGGDVGFHVECQNCHLRTSMETTRERAIAIWNSRVRATNPVTFYVDTVNGSDANNGFFESPFCTLEFAQSVAEEKDLIVVLNADLVTQAAVRLAEAADSHDTGAARAEYWNSLTAYRAAKTAAKPTTPDAAATPVAPTPITCDESDSAGHLTAMNKEPGFAPSFTPVNSLPAWYGRTDGSSVATPDDADRAAEAFVRPYHEGFRFGPDFEAGSCAIDPRKTSQMYAVKWMRGAVASLIRAQRAEAAKAAWDEAKQIVLSVREELGDSHRMSVVINAIEAAARHATGQGPC